MVVVRPRRTPLRSSRRAAALPYNISRTFQRRRTFHPNDQESDVYIGLGTLLLIIILIIIFA